MSGLEVCRALHEKLGEDLPVILVSGERWTVSIGLPACCSAPMTTSSSRLSRGHFIARVRRLVGKVRRNVLHIQRLLAKFGVRRQSQMVAAAYRDGLIELPAASKQNGAGQG
jgi:hypothetical protein